MTSYSWPAAPSMPATADAPVAVLLPGAGYTVQAPLLYWCATLLVERGWHVQAVDWTVGEAARADPLEFVEQAVTEAFAASPASGRRLLVAKSFGTFALPWARRSGIAGVWLTPMLTEEPVRRALAAATPADLAIGGDRDPFWQPDTVAGTAARLVTEPGANHALTLPGDWQGSIRLQERVLATVSGHLTG